MIRAGFNGGNWLGNGITSSTANANRNYAIAIADNSQLVIKFGDGTPGGGRLFSGQVVDSTTILVKFTHRDRPGPRRRRHQQRRVDLQQPFREGSPAYWAIGDVDYDGIFTSNDASIFNSFYNEALAGVPEPATLGVLGIGTLGLLRRRRQRSA